MADSDFVGGAPADPEPLRPMPRMPEPPYLLVWRDCQGVRDGIDIDYWVETAGDPHVLLRYAAHALHTTATALGLTVDEALEKVHREVRLGTNARTGDIPAP